MESEVKILEIDPEAVITKLGSLDAEQVFDGVLRAVFFDRGSSLRDSRTTLRVRAEGAHSTIAVKILHESAEYKTSDEYEFSGSFDDAIAALTALGFEAYAHSEKHRTSYRSGSVRIDIDRFLDDTFVPPFLEVEGAPDDIERAIVELGLENHRRVSWSGYELREYYAQRST